MQIRYLKKILAIFTAVAIFAGIVQMLNYLYRSTDDSLYRILWHDYYKDRGKIENLYVGSSHVYCDIDSPMMTELTGEYCFDMATPSQRLNGTYYLLREADRGNQLKHVYVELFFMLTTVNEGGQEPIDSGTAFSCNWKNTDYMKLSTNKIAYMFSIGGVDKYIDILLPFCRYREKLGDWDYIKQTITDKNEIWYSGYQGNKDSENEKDMKYLGQGHWNSTKTFADSSKCWRQNRILSEQTLGYKSKAYIQRIIRYCQEKEIPITLFVSPINNIQLISTANYDCYVNEIREIADAYAIPFYDFNLAKEQYFPIQQNKYFMDAGHLNKAGAELFTQFFYQVVSQGESENREYFCASYEEKLHKSAPAVYGAYYKEPTDPSATMKNMRIASNRDSGMEYRITLTPEQGKGEPYIIRDFSEDKEFQTPLAEEGICAITARMTGSSSELQTIEINY